MTNRWWNNGNSGRLYFRMLQNHFRWWLLCGIKTLVPWKKSYDQPRQHIKNRDSALPMKVQKSEIRVQAWSRYDESPPLGSYMAISCSTPTMCRAERSKISYKGTSSIHKGFTLMISPLLITYQRFHLLIL